MRSSSGGGPMHRVKWRVPMVRGMGLAEELTVRPGASAVSVVAGALRARRVLAASGGVGGTGIVAHPPLPGGAAAGGGGV